MPAGLTTDGLLGRRYLARLIDSFALAAILFVVSVLSGPVLGMNAVTPEAAYLLLLLTVWIAYGALQESSPLQATFGKRIMRLRVYDSQGSRMGLGRATLRNLVKDGPFFALPLVPFGQILILVWLFAHLFAIHRSPACQAIHDHAAQTWVAAPEEITQLRLS